MKRNNLVRKLTFCVLLAGYCNFARAVTLTNIYVFNGTNDGSDPVTGVVQGNDGNLYGATAYGGTNADCGGVTVGTVFRINPSGSNFTTLCSFPSSDGDGPYGGAALVQGSDGNFYDTTYGYPCGAGTVFKVTPGGSFTTIYSFDDPAAGLAQGNDGNFYGTTAEGCGAGSLFAISSSGSFTNLYCFSGSDGANPYGGLVQGSDGNFYGTTKFGGTNNAGIVLKITPSGALSILHDFNVDDGSLPVATLVQGRDGNFYGTTEAGGTNLDDGNNANGTVFKISSTGTFTTLHEFLADASDGGFPNPGLVQGSDGNFYGMTTEGGTNTDAFGTGYGVVFRVTPSGGFTNLYEFNGHLVGDGFRPLARLVQGCDGNFYGTTAGGGTNGMGVIFKLIVPLNASNPPPNQVSAIQIVGSNVVITVPSISGEQYRLQYSATMSTAVWINVAGAGVSNSIGGPLTLTDVGGAVNTQRFYRVDVFACSADAFSDPVGFITLTVEGTNAAGTTAYSFLGLGMTPIPALRGTVGTASGQQVPVDNELTPGQFDAILIGGVTNAQFYIENVNAASTNAGFSDDIVSNDAANVYTANGDSANFANGDSFKVYPHWTLDSVFGSSDQLGVVVGSNTLAHADSILVWNPVAQGSATYWYRTSGTTPGWRSANSVTADAGNTPLYVDQGIQIQRNYTGTNLDFKLVGAVKLGNTITTVPTGPSSYAFVANMYAGGVTLSNIDLYTGNPSTGVFGSNTAANADNVLVWDPVAQGFTMYWYRTSGTTHGWRDSNSTSIDRGTNVFAIGTVFQIQRKYSPSFTWTMHAPY